MKLLLIFACLGAAAATSMLPGDQRAKGFGFTFRCDFVLWTGIVGDQVPAQYPAIDLHVPEACANS